MRQEQRQSHEDLCRGYLLQGESAFHEIEYDRYPQEGRHQNQDRRSQGKNGQEEQELDRKNHLLVALSLPHIQVDVGEGSTGSGGAKARVLGKDRARDEQ